MQRWREGRKASCEFLEHKALNIEEGGIKADSTLSLGHYTRSNVRVGGVIHFSHLEGEEGGGREKGGGVCPHDRDAAASRRLKDSSA